jgi:hypothetical protein
MPVTPLDLLVSGGLALDLNSLKGCSASSSASGS